ncbi:MAG: hypothetical protein ACTH1M_09735, partial [Microbacterium sp.]
MERLLNAVASSGGRERTVEQRPCDPSAQPHDPDPDNQYGDDRQDRNRLNDQRDADQRQYQYGSAQRRSDRGQQQRGHHRPRPRGIDRLNRHTEEVQTAMQFALIEEAGGLIHPDRHGD